MPKENLFVLILAAGHGTRMKTTIPKVLQPLCGKPLLEHVLDQAIKLSPTIIVPIISEHVKSLLNIGHNNNTIETCIQHNPQGTGHAISCAMPLIENETGTVIILSGDVPLIKDDTLLHFIDSHHKNTSTISVLAFKKKAPFGYGRIIKDENGVFCGIVEQKDLPENYTEIHEVNSSIYCIDKIFLAKWLPQLLPNNQQNELYLTDLVALAYKNNYKTLAFEVEDTMEFSGINDLVQLADLEAHLQKQLRLKHMKNGVRLIDPQTTYFSMEAVIQPDVVIHPGCHILGASRIGRGTVIEPYCYLNNCKIGENEIIKLASHLNNSN